MRGRRYCIVYLLGRGFFVLFYFIFMFYGVKRSRVDGLGASGEFYFIFWVAWISDCLFLYIRIFLVIVIIIFASAFYTSSFSVNNCSD